MNAALARISFNATAWIHFAVSSPDLDITEATGRDLTVVVDVYSKSFVPMVKGYHPDVDPAIFDIDKLTEMWKNLLAVQPVFLVRQRGDGSPVAVLALKRTDRREVIELAKLFVVPEAQSTGVAQIVTDFAIRFAMSEGYEEVELWTWEIGNQGRRFYEKIGFSLADERGVSGYPGVNPEDDVTVRYVKQLN